MSDYVKYGRNVALITGGSSGIGMACVRQFSRKGWRISVVSLPGPNLNRLAELDVLTSPGDITDSRIRETVVARTLYEYNRIDVLVNCAGVGLYACPAETPLSGFSRLLEVNVLAPLALTQLVIPVMREQGGGTIVNVGSIAGRVALPWAAAYSASKSALDSMHDSLRREFRREAIHFVKVLPGIVDTNFRNNVLRGSVPPAVSRVSYVVSADTVAASIIRAVERGRRTVYVPWIGAIFTLMDALAPWFMDIYLSRFLATAKPAAVTPEDSTTLRPVF